MSEEEKEAIKYLKKHIIPYNNINGNLEFLVNDVLLNLIEKLQKENAELKEENIILEGNKIGLKLAIQELKEKIENEIKELEENEYFYREHDRMYEYEGKINLLKRLLAKFE